MWGDKNTYALFLDSDNKIHKIKADFENVFYKMKVNSLQGESKLLNLVSVPNDDSKLTLLQIEECKKEPSSALSTNHSVSSQTLSRITKKMIQF